jgi:DNA-binding transcriptional ArsR family regulator
MPPATPQLDAMLAALADPARRAAVDLLRRGPRRAGELATVLELSAARMSQHLRVLRECGAIVEETSPEDARARSYRLRREPFEALRTWLDAVEGFWSAELASFKAHVERGATSRSARPRRRT